MANYNEFYKGISATDEYLVRFFKNLLLGESNPLSNREMHISKIKSLTPKSQNDTLKEVFFRERTASETASGLSRSKYGDYTSA